MAPNRDSVDGKLVGGYEEGVAHGAGAFWYGDGCIFIMIPGHKWAGEFGGDHMPVRLPFDRWKWDGNREKPTLTPSILLNPGPDEVWHGFMTAGRLVSC